MSSEIDYIKEIIKFFSDTECIKDYKIGGYIIDLYLPEYNLCIYIDQNKNNYINDDFIQTEKEQTLITLIDCDFVIFNPSDETFTLISVIREIYLYIVNELKIKRIISDLKMSLKD